MQEQENQGTSQNVGVTSFIPESSKVLGTTSFLRRKITYILLSLFVLVVGFIVLTGWFLIKQNTKDKKISAYQQTLQKYNSSIQKNKQLQKNDNAPLKNHL